jgi:hypothetical protein
MSGTTPDPAAGLNPFGELAKFALAATERNMALARSSSDAPLTTLKEQSEDARATLTTRAASLRRWCGRWPGRRRPTATCNRAWRAIGCSLTATGPRRSAPPGWYRAPSTTSRRPARADGGGGGDRAVHADDAGVDRRFHPLQRAPNSRSPIIVISALSRSRCRPMVSLPRHGHKGEVGIGDEDPRLVLATA